MYHCSNICILIYTNNTHFPIQTGFQLSFVVTQFIHRLNSLTSLVNCKRSKLRFVYPEFRFSHWFWLRTDSLVEIHCHRTQLNLCFVM